MGKFILGSDVKCYMPKLQLGGGLKTALDLAQNKFLTTPDVFLSADESGRRGVFKELVASALLEYNKIRQGQIGKGESSTLGKLHIHGIDSKYISKTINALKASMGKTPNAQAVAEFKAKRSRE
jgi:hypothetical protein